MDVTEEGSWNSTTETIRDVGFVRERCVSSPSLDELRR